MGVGSPWIHNFPSRLPAGDVRTCWLGLENRSEQIWLEGAFKVSIDLDGARTAQLDLLHPVGPGERVNLYWVFRTTNDLGRHEFRFDLVAGEKATAGAHQPVPPLHVAVDIADEPVTATRSLRDLVYDNHARCWLPVDGMSWSSAGSGYPQFAREARGC